MATRLNTSHSAKYSVPNKFERGKFEQGNFEEGPSGFAQSGLDQRGLERGTGGTNLESSVYKKDLGGIRGTDIRDSGGRSSGVLARDFRSNSPAIASSSNTSSAIAASSSTQSSISGEDSRLTRDFRGSGEQHTRSSMGPRASELRVNQESDTLQALRSPGVSSPAAPSSTVPSTAGRVANPGEPQLEESLDQLARLMANVTDAYTVTIFLSDAALRIASKVPATKIAAARGDSSRSHPPTGTFGALGSTGVPGKGITAKSSGTASIGASFESDPHSSPQTLELVAYHTLSREIIPNASIAYGSGLIGWTAENGVRISVCPFEHDARTLLFYSADQALKSFIALPILDDEGGLLGVLSCDSKKSYAFAKVTEKILIDCASQISHLISLHGQLKKKQTKNQGETLSEEVNREVIKFLDHLRAQPSERRLLAEAANLPQDFVERDALVVVATPPGEWKSYSPTSPAAHSSCGTLSTGNLNSSANLGSGVFPSPTNQARVSNRLMELVCRHKRVLCGERNVQALTQDEKLQRSFLSIPFRVTNREAGSLNLLSPAFGSFSASEIGILERVAEVLGRELELHRLRERFVSVQESSGLLPWRVFRELARQRFSLNREKKLPSSLLRVRISCLSMLEDCLGVEGAHEAHHQMLRLVEQVKGSGNLGCYLVGSDCLLFIDGLESDRILSRFRHLLSRLELGRSNSPSADQSSGREGGSEQAGKAALGISMSKLGEELKRGIYVTSVSSPRDGEDFDVLVSKSLRIMEKSLSASEKRA